VKHICEPPVDRDAGFTAGYMETVLAG